MNSTTFHTFIGMGPQREPKKRKCVAISKLAKASQGTPRDSKIFRKTGHAEAVRISSEKFDLTMVTASEQDVKDYVDLLDVKLSRKVKSLGKEYNPKSGESHREELLK
jgi:hypothetical protein